MSSVIKVENLSKRYIIGHQEQERYLTLRDTMTRKFKQAGKRLLHPFLSSSGQPLMGVANTEEFWALKDVSFEVNQGDRIGIIGRNGAGKSTLLKILSRITEPTTGRVKIKGRVASLLEVGTGFHPELTGRENIFLNGAILGMGKEEIKEKYDAIVAFSEIEKFLDTPVKRYSSGMYVRLAFAVAAHLEPEILLVDEVLAVGDAQFQKKCLGKMEEVGKQGRTVLFVSHNIATVKAFTSRAVLLDKGRKIEDGATELVLDQYSRLTSDRIQASLFDRRDRKGNGKLRFTDINIEDAQGRTNDVAISGQDTRVSINFTRKDDIGSGEFVFSLSFETLSGEKLLLFRNDYTGERLSNIPATGKVVCLVPRFPLIPGIYRVSVYAERNGEILDWIAPASEIQVAEGDFFGTGKTKNPKFGPFLASHSWKVEP